MENSNKYKTFSFKWQLAVILETLTEAKTLFNFTKRTFVKKLNKGKVYNYVEIERYQ